MLHAAAQHPAAVRWSAMLDQPHISPAARMRADFDLGAHITVNPQWSAVWMAGTLRALTLTLPSDDPWRRVAATYTGERWHSQREPLHPDGTTEEIPDNSGDAAAFLNGQPFGSYADGLDIYPHDSRLLDPWLDPALTVLTGPFDPTGLSLGGHLHPTEIAPLRRISAALIGLSGGDDQSPVPVLTHAVRDVLTRFTGDEALVLWGDALRWVAWRRSCYVGSEDDYASGAALAWVGWASLAVAPNRLLDDAPLRDLADHLIPPGSYTNWRNYVRDCSGDEDGPDWMDLLDLE